ncbi:hypothetical protein [Hymenobacter perfusus]|uniref:hypothetical protein n=1 Tax=Hymenobacter perfusus TaxID=1236770 RepID=UPI0014775581|nr:hypothetical protein [Hymenobacter perfusus]
MLKNNERHLSEMPTVTVLRWVRAYGWRAEQQMAEASPKQVRSGEVDELHGYVG